MAALHSVAVQHKAQAYNLAKKHPRPAAHLLAVSVCPANLQPVSGFVLPARSAQTLLKKLDIQGLNGNLYYLNQLNRPDYLKQTRPA